MSGRRRTNVRQYSAEDQALTAISKEAESRLAAKRAARAEAKEIRMREIEKQQKEAEEKLNNEQHINKPQSRQDRTGSRRGSDDSSESGVDGYSTTDRDLKKELRSLEEKYKVAMMSSAQLDNEKQSLVYQVELLKDQLEEQAETHTELQREYKEKTRNLELTKRELQAAQLELKALREQNDYKDRLIAESGLVIVAAENGDLSLQQNPDGPSSNDPVGAGAVLLSSEALDMLNKGAEGSLGTHHLATSPHASHTTYPTPSASASPTQQPGQARTQSGLLGGNGTAVGAEAVCTVSSAVAAQVAIDSCDSVAGGYHDNSENTDFEGQKVDDTEGGSDGGTLAGGTIEKEGDKDTGAGDAVQGQDGGRGYGEAADMCTVMHDDARNDGDGQNEVKEHDTCVGIDQTFDAATQLEVADVKDTKVGGEAFSVPSVTITECSHSQRANSRESEDDVDEFFDAVSTPLPSPFHTTSTFEVQGSEVGEDSTDRESSAASECPEISAEHEQGMGVGKKGIVQEGCTETDLDGRAATEDLGLAANAHVVVTQESKVFVGGASDQVAQGGGDEHAREQNEEGSPKLSSEDASISQAAGAAAADDDGVQDGGDETVGGEDEITVRENDQSIQENHENMNTAVEIKTEAGGGCLGDGGLGLGNALVSVRAEGKKDMFEDGCQSVNAEHVEMSEACERDVDVGVNEDMPSSVHATAQNTVKDTRDSSDMAKQDDSQHVTELLKLENDNVDGQTEEGNTNKLEVQTEHTSDREEQDGGETGTEAGEIVVSCSLQAKDAESAQTVLIAGTLDSDYQEDSETINEPVKSEDVTAKEADQETVVAHSENQADAAGVDEHAKSVDVTLAEEKEGKEHIDKGIVSADTRDECGDESKEQMADKEKADSDDTQEASDTLSPLSEKRKQLGREQSEGGTSEDSEARLDEEYDFDDIDEVLVDSGRAANTVIKEMDAKEADAHSEDAASILSKDSGMQEIFKSWHDSDLTLGELSTKGDDGTEGRDSDAHARDSASVASEDSGTGKEGQADVGAEGGLDREKDPSMDSLDLEAKLDKLAAAPESASKDASKHKQSSNKKSKKFKIFKNIFHK